MLITCVMGLDDRYFAEFQAAWVTYRIHRPQLLENRWLFVCDGNAHGAEFWEAEIRSVVGRSVQFDVLVWTMQNVSQREKMLNGLSFGPTMCVETDWFVKIDCDSYCIGSDRPLWDESWFRSDVPFVASPWGYTKPARMIDDLESWSKNVSLLRELPAVRYRPWNRRGLVYARHNRVISFVYYGNTEWHRWANSLCCQNGSVLPVPSQDTYYSWLASKVGNGWLAASMKKRGWAHSHRGVLQQKAG